MTQKLYALSMNTYAFIDASNLFYGGEKNLGWKIDYKKLLEYLKDKYSVSHVFYFGGVEIHDFEYDYQKNETVPLNELEKHLTASIKNKGAKLNEADLLLMGRHLKRINFYQKLNNFGYKLYLKPVKLYDQEDGTTKRKANCDVDMAFHLMKEKDNFNKAIILSGDGDFLPVLKYLREKSKDVLIFARGSRTAKEIKQFAGDKFLDFTRLEHKLKYEQ
jgi:uncharacterized LabA/DUF88 family protein